MTIPTMKRLLQPPRGARQLAARVLAVLTLGPSLALAQSTEHSRDQ